MKCEKCGAYLVEEGLADDSGKKVCLNCMGLGQRLQAKNFNINNVASLENWNKVKNGGDKNG